MHTLASSTTAGSGLSYERTYGRCWLMLPTSWDVCRTSILSHEPRGWVKGATEVGQSFAIPI